MHRKKKLLFFFQRTINIKECQSQKRNSLFQKNNQIERIYAIFSIILTLILIKKNYLRELIIIH